MENYLNSFLEGLDYLLHVMLVYFVYLGGKAIVHVYGKGVYYNCGQALVAAICVSFILPGDKIEWFTIILVPLLIGVLVKSKRNLIDKLNR